MLLVAIYFGLFALNICATDLFEIQEDIPAYKNFMGFHDIGLECSQSDTFLYCNYLPINLPINVTHLYVQGEHGVKIHHIVSSFFFDGENWNNLKALHLMTSMGINRNAMKNLESLEELHVSSEHILSLYKGAFAGLNNLKILSLSVGDLLEINGLTVAMESKNIVPHLEALSLKLCFLKQRGKKLKVILNKPSKSLDLTFVNTDEFSFIRFLWSFKCPERINISHSTFVNKNSYFKFLMFPEFLAPFDLDLYPFTSAGFSFIFLPKTRASRILNLKKLKTKSIADLKVFDASYISSPMVNVFVRVVLKLRNTSIILPSEIVTLVSRAEIVNISGINRLSSTIKLQKLSVYMLQYFSRQSPTRELVVKNNGLQYLDVTFHCNKSNLEILDLSSNVIEFIHPNMCSCCTRLTEINLSQNNLFKMAARNYSLFGRIISSYQNLKYVQLSFNKLTEIPTEMFRENMHLQQIDLSNNDLTKITFYLGHLLSLKTLNLKNNRFLMFDSTSLTNLELIKAQNVSANKRIGILVMDNNPMLCSECKFLPFIKWLATSPLIDRNGNKIFCKDPGGLSVHANENAAQNLQEECDRPKWIRNVIILSSVTPIGTTALIVISICTCLRWRRQRLRRKNIAEKIELIQRNKLDTPFVVFLSHSSEDTPFLNEYVYYPLKFHLQERLQTERDIICLGDRHFQLGKPINDEMVRSLQQSAVVLLLLSRNFCRSEFCRMEFDHALLMNKPFVIMVKGEIDINEMVPSLQELFRRNTRLLWERDGETFLMKTSWDNVSSSILELIK